MVTYPALWRRYAASLTFSAATTFALLLLMNDLISQPGPELKQPPPPWIPDLYRLPEEYKPPLPPPPVPPDRPDPPPVTKVETYDPFAGPGGEVDFVKPETAVPVSPRGTGVADGDVLPIFKVTPNYPLTAAKRGVEGYVVIRFTVDELGRIVDPEIVEAMPAGFFNRSALEAVRRFKYRPRVLNGQPTRVTGMVHRLVYELVEA